MNQPTKSALVAAVVGAAFGFAVFLPIFFASEMKADNTVPGGVLTTPRFFTHPLTGEPLGYNTIYDNNGTGPVVRYERTSACLHSNWMAFNVVAKFHLAFIAAFAVIFAAIGRAIAKRMPDSAPAKAMVVASEWYGRAITKARGNLRQWRDYRGRASRQEMWWPFATWTVWMVILAFAAATFGAFGAIVYAIFLVVALVALLPLHVRRLHDCGLRGWWLLVVILVAGVTKAAIQLIGIQSEIIGDIPQLIIIAFTLHQVLRRGAPGANRFGEPVTAAAPPAAPVAPVVPAAPEPAAT